jgi:hypothetical protein
MQNENPDWPAYKKIFHARNLTPHGTRYPRLRNLDWTYASQYGIHCEPEFIFLPKVSNSSWRWRRDSRNRRTLQLMRNIPIEVEEIESLMNNKSYYILKINSLAQSRLFFFGAVICFYHLISCCSLYLCSVNTAQEDATAIRLNITNSFHNILKQSTTKIEKKM